jgi:2-dehydro-3-deoxy-D-arabinonate dehydratase
VALADGSVHTVVERDDEVLLAGRGAPSLAELLHAPDPVAAAESFAATGRQLAGPFRWLAPIERQEVWAAGVTYSRSKQARMDESEGAARFYNLVYDAPRPEIFFKGTPSRTSGPGEPVRIRADATWNVPEPELALVISPALKLVGFTVGNDMSSRDIEGENPLYLPQAKCYRQSTALGPAVLLAPFLPPIESVTIRLTIRRGGAEAFAGDTPLSRLKRTFDELINWLGRDNVFPDGVILLTGTGIVPPDRFTLEPGDEVSITIDGIGTLTNPVVRG